MDYPELDRAAYRRWWASSSGRADMGRCPCGQQALDWYVENHRLIATAEYGTCVYHQEWDRDTLAAAIADGTYVNERAVLQDDLGAAKYLAGTLPPLWN